MRFRQLELEAYGSFSGSLLEFGAGAGDFQLVFGPNEAGKSTLLRAIFGFLYGIPHVTRDAYLHSAPQLRISAEITDGAASMRLTRRKGRKSTLLGASGEPVDEALLGRSLMGVDQSVYSALFGLDHETLRAGGAALARGEGQLGESLYSAGAGSAVRRVLESLRAEAEQLYVSKGKRRINQLLARVKQAEQALDLAITPPGSWKQQHVEVLRLEQEVERLSALQQAAAAEQRQLEGLRSLRRRVSRLDLTRRELEQLGEPLELPQGFAAERQRWTQAAAEAQREGRRRAAELADAEQALQRLGAAEPIGSLDPEEMDSLAQRLGSHAKAVLDLPRRRGELQAVEHEISRALSDLGLPSESLSLDSLVLPSKSLRAELKELLIDGSRLEATLSAKRQAVSQAVAQRSRTSARLAELPEADFSQLERALSAARVALTHSERERELAAELIERREGIAEALAELGLPPDTEIARVRLPSREAIAEFEAQFSALAEQLREGERAEAELGRRLDKNRAEIIELEGAQAIPAQADLVAARAERDRAWAALDDALRARELPSGAVVRAFNLELKRADDLADRLWTDAGRVAEKRELEKLGAALALKLEAARSERADHDLARQALLEAWQALLDGSELSPPRKPSPPREPSPPGTTFPHGHLPTQVLSWRDALAAIAERQLATAQQARELSRLSQQVAEQRERLILALSAHDAAPPGASLEQLVDSASARVSQLSRQSTERESQLNRLHELTEQVLLREAELEETAREHARWLERWRVAVQSLGFSQAASPSVVSSALEGFTQLELKLADRRGLSRRVSGMERDAAVLARDLDALCASFAPDLCGQDPAIAGAEFKRRYQAERLRLQHAAALAADRAQLTSALAQAERAEREANAELERLCRTAGVDKSSSSRDKLLAEAEQRAEAQARLRTALTEIQRELLEEGAGVGDSLERILAAVAAREPQALELRLSEIESELPELDERYRGAIAALASTREGLSQLSLGTAAERKEELEVLLSELGREVTRYRRLKLAEAILSQEVERYRAENQGPLLERANQLFPRLTLGRYVGLGLAFDAEDRAILEAIPSPGEGGLRVRVDDLSDGARDQLYLALRIASIERYVAAGMRLPVVLDDILVHFDEQRAAVALELLAELSRQTQVLFFTHHRRHIELAEQVLSPDRYRLHELPA